MARQLRRLSGLTAATLIVAVAIEARQPTSADQTATPPATLSQGGRGGTQQQPAVVPDLIGTTEQQARDLLAKARLSVGEISRAEANVKPGTVFKQTYAAGARLKPGTAVGFVLAMRVSPPPVKMATVPDLFGMSEAKAISLLGDKDLKVGAVTRAEANARPGTVFRQDPRPGLTVRVGTPVSIAVALPTKVPIPPDRGGGGTGDAPPVKLVTVPDLFSASEAKASSLLSDRNLKVGDVSRAEANARPGTVFKQDPPAGERVKAGTAVSFVLALPIKIPIPPDRGGGRGGGAPPVKLVTVPDLFSASEARAGSLLNNEDLKVGEVTRAEANARPGTVFKQDPPAGARVRPGTAVNFVIAQPINVPIPPDRGGRGITPPPVKMATVPDLSGAMEEKARDLLVNAGLQVGEVTKAESNNKPLTVFKQDSPAGAQVTAGTAVGFVLAVPITVEVPPLEGNTQGNAVSILRNRNLQPGTIKEEPSRVPKGQVLSQGTPAGTRVAAGSAIDFTIAAPITLSVPQLRKLPQPDAVALLKKHELAVGDVTSEESREMRGTVLSQRPPAGTVVEVGTRVSFVVATPLMVDVPPLVDRTSDDAVAQLKKLGLLVGNVTSEESRRNPDTVLSQAPTAGTRVTIGTAVAFVTARPVTALVPNVVSMLEADARKALTASELAVGSVRVEEARTAPGSVLRQSIAAGRRVTIGTAVDLVTATRVTVLVPRIAGLKEDAAVAAVVAAGLRPGVRYQESPAERGIVLTQAIDPDTRVPVETLVDFVVSAVETVPMPSVVGTTTEEARQRLVAGRLSVGSEAIRPVRSESRGIVLAQSVDAGARIPVGTAIVLTVSTPELVEVPRVVDLPRTDAFTAINSAGLKVGQVSRGLSFMRAGGTIVGQGLAPGLRVEFGTAVAVDEALPRIIWAGPATGLIAVAGLLQVRSRRRRRLVERPRSTPPQATPPLDVSAKANVDVGDTTVSTDDARAIRVELRIVPVAGSAMQDITADARNVISSERRVTKGEPTNEERPS